jgi:hypothetical protein
MVLGLIWQIGKLAYFVISNLNTIQKLIRLLNPGEQLSDILKISPKQLLVRWFNYHLKAAGYEKKITNFSGDAKDSENNTKIII